MELWIVVTLIAALAQTIRFAIMRQLKATRLSSTGTTFARYVYSAPLAAVGALAYAAIWGLSLPTLTPAFWLYTTAGGATQIIGTVCLMSLFARRSFAVGMAFLNTTVLMAVPVGFIWLGDTTSVLGFMAILLGFFAVTLLSDVPDEAGRGFGARVFNLGSGFGLAAGLLFAMAGVGYRGAVLEMGALDPIFRALVTLAIATALQTAIMAVWMAWRTPSEIGRVFAAWRVAGLVGVLSMIGSTGWFTAFALQNVAYVNAVGQIEMVFSLFVALFIFRERITTREWQGGSLLTLSILALILYA